MRKVKLHNMSELDYLRLRQDKWIGWMVNYRNSSNVNKNGLFDLEHNYLLQLKNRTRK